jgi:hypothetical protein
LLKNIENIYHLNQKGNFSFGGTQYWDLNSGPLAGQAGVLPLESHFWSQVKILLYSCIAGMTGT